MYSCVFILLRLSGERSFAVSLNRPYTVRLPIDLPKFTGSYADLLIIVRHGFFSFLKTCCQCDLLLLRYYNRWQVAHKIIVTSPDHLDALLNVILTALLNVSPYITRLDLLSRFENIVGLSTTGMFNAI